MKLARIPLLVLLSLRLFAAEYVIRVESGDDRLENVIITAPLPRGANDFPEAGMLVAGGRHPIQFQKTPERDAIVFVLPNIEPQSLLRFHLQGMPGTRAMGTHADLDDGVMTLSAYGKKILKYQGEESKLPRPDIKEAFKRGGYIHPVYSPSGRTVTDDYPPNHIHHHGIWFPWTKTSFEGRAPDFWNMGEGKGKVEFVKFADRWSGPVSAGFTAEHRFVDLTAEQPRVALSETWTVTAYYINGADYFVFDLESVQQCTTTSPLILPKYHYGGLGVRGNWAWNGKEATSFLTSEGETDRVKGNETRGKWCYMGGEVNGLQTGVTVMSHPDNFRFPQPMRLHPSEPFFCFAPSQLGDWQIEPGKPYVSKYRFIVSDGPPSQEKLERIWQSYGHSLKTTVERL